MGCAASTSTGATPPPSSAPATESVSRPQAQITEAPKPPHRSEEDAGFACQLLVDGTSIILVKALTYTVGRNENHSISTSLGAPLTNNTKPPSAETWLIRRHALERVSELLQLDEPMGAVPKHLIKLKEKLQFNERFVPLRSISAVSPQRYRDEGSSELGLCVRSKYFTDASSLEPFCGNAEEKVVEDVFMAVSEALAELHDLNAAHLNLHAGNVLRVPTDGGGTDQYLLGDYGWGPLWSALSVTERRGFLKKGLSDALLPPERFTTVGDHVDLRSTPLPGDTDVKADVWGLGVLLYKLIYGVAPCNDGRALSTMEVCGQREGRDIFSGGDLEFPLISPTGWLVSDRWLWLLSSLLSADPALRPRDLRLLRIEFKQRSAKKKLSRVESSSPILVPEVPVNDLFAFPSGNLMGNDGGKPANDGGKPAKRASAAVRARSTFGGGFQPLNLASFLLTETDQQSQSTTSFLSSQSTAYNPGSPSTSASLTANRLHLGKSSSNSSTQEGSMIGSVPLAPLALSLGLHKEIFVDQSDSIRCIRCGGDVAPLAFRCTQCPDFTLCSRCFIEHGEEHDPEHCILTFAVERLKEVELASSIGKSIRGAWRSTLSESLAGASGADESAQLEGSKNLFVSAAALTPHERTVLGMTGKLPTGCYLETLKRKKSAWTISTSQSVPPSKQLPTPQEAEFNESNDKETKLWKLEAEPVLEVSEEDIVRRCWAETSSELELCELSLAAVPPCIFAIARNSATPFIHVTTLDLANNAISEIPPGLCLLFPNLETFLVGNNQLTSFPEAVSELVNLRRLELHRNKLTAIPTSIVRLNKLQYCSLDDNDLEAIPDFVWEMPSLETLFLAMNPRLKHWPPLHVLVDWLDGVGNLQLGLDNAPSLWNVFRSTVSERCPSLTVVWNKIYPDEILPGRLYLGALRSAQSPEVYEELRIGSVLTVGRGLNPKILPGMNHFTLDVDDLPGSSIVDRFADCFRFIDEAPASKPDAPGVLVHCWAGMSRSATCVIAYLMQKFHWRLEDAFAHTKARREAIHPNDGFMEQLKAYDRKLFPAE